MLKIHYWDWPIFLSRMKIWRHPHWDYYYIESLWRISHFDLLNKTMNLCSFNDQPAEAWFSLEALWEGEDQFSRATHYTHRPIFTRPKSLFTFMSAPLETHPLLSREQSAHVRPTFRYIGLKFPLALRLLPPTWAMSCSSNIRQGTRGSPTSKQRYFGKRQRFVPLERVTCFEASKGPTPTLANNWPSFSFQLPMFPRCLKKKKKKNANLRSGRSSSMNLNSTQPTYLVLPSSRLFSARPLCKNVPQCTEHFFLSSVFSLTACLPAFLPVCSFQRNSRSRT